MHGFDKITKRLRMIGVSAKIETARLKQDESGFAVLAETVEELSEVIKTKSVDIKKKEEALSSFILMTLKNTSELEKKINLNSGSILRDIDQSIASLQTEQQTCVMTNEKIASVSATVSCGISDIVSAIQFHDITRQQIEHVAESLKRIVEALKGDDEYNAVHTAYDLLQLQSSQLGNATREFASATEKIRNRFSAISVNVEQMAAYAAEMTGSNASNGETYLKEINSGVQDIFRLLKENEAVELELVKSTEKSESAISELSSHIVKIEETGNEIHLIAINASIKAAHTGNEGVALGVLAEAIQKLSAESTEQTEGVTVILTRISEITQKLRSQKANESLFSRQQGLSDISKLLEEIGKAEAELEKNIRYLAGASEELSLDIASVVEGFNVQEMILSANDRAAAAMNEIRQELFPYIDNEYLEKNRNRLEDYTMNYTMDSERRIYGNVAGESSDSDEQESQSEFGYNIELFLITKSL
jgi:methyl-accepting chemotaxis protein